MTRLDDKLARIRAGRRSDRLHNRGRKGSRHGTGPPRSRRQREGAGHFHSREEFLQSIEAVIRQDVVDIMLTSVSNLEKLTERNAFAGRK